MLLYFTPTSPYVRKVLVTAHELGLASEIETQFLRPSPMAPSAELSRHNPLSKIPALVLADGSTLYDSRVICEYLDSQRPAGVPSLLGSTPAERFDIFRRQALCDGVLEAAILVFYERTQRPAELHWESWIAGQLQKATQGLDALETEVHRLGADVDLSQVALGAALGWLDFRGVVGDFRQGRPRLAAWWDTFSARPSMRATVPTA
jgi:glutathione S-transferase